MSIAFYVIAILGCGEGEAQCEPVRTAEARYESREACLAATDAVLARAEAAEFPTLVAECRPLGAAPVALNARDVALPEPQVRRAALSK